MTQTLIIQIRPILSSNQMKLYSPAAGGPWSVRPELKAVVDNDQVDFIAWSESAWDFVQQIVCGCPP